MQAKGNGVMGTISDAVRQLAGKVEVDFVDWHEACKDKVRRQAIVTDALFESALDCVIQLRLSPKDEVLGQLLSATKMNDKTRLAYVLGLITKGTMQDLQHMHNIRNTFAHARKPDWSNPDLVKQVLRLSTVKGKRKQVIGLNLMDFYSEARRKCRDSILKAIDELHTAGDTTERRVRQTRRTSRR